MSIDANAAEHAEVDSTAAGDVDGRGDADVEATMADSPLGPGEDATPAERAIWEALDGVEDPHLPLSLVEMAMIYDVRVEEGGAATGDGGTGGDATTAGDAATVEITFPCMGCPAYDFIHDDVEAACREAGVEAVEIDVVWDPVWSKDMMPTHAKETLRASGIGI